MWKNTKAAIYRAKDEKLRAIKEIDDVKLSDLLGIETQKQALLKNTLSFIEGNRANHALLWGARGTGKSSLIKAILNELSDKGLRVIEFNKEDLKELPYIVDEIRYLAYKFIIFCDDLSFEKNDDSYKGLKPILEGSIELPPKNTLVYATSNRRHLVTEMLEDNAGTLVTKNEIHYSDGVEEKISLSDRFGLSLSFYQGSFEEYLTLVRHYFKDEEVDFSRIETLAKKFAINRASRSGRTAKQFYYFYKSGLCG